MPTLAVVIASTRPGRRGLPIGTWFAEQARTHGHFEVDLVDLAEVGLPILDEPHHPRLRRYTHQHTIEWSARIDAADAFVFVSPEYNYAMPPALVNALDYLSAEWAFKPAGLLTYGGLSGGLRAAQSIKVMLAALQMFPVGPAVAVPFMNRYLSEDVFEPEETVTSSAKAMLDELARVEPAFASLRR